MAYGVTPEGFVLKRLVDIRQDMVDVLSTVTDPVSGETLIVDLADENDPLVQQVNAFSDALSATWEQLQAAYNQFDPLKASGAGLTGTVQLNKLRRKGGTFSTAPVSLTGTPNQPITTGKQITDNLDTNVWSLPGFVFDGAGLATVTATAVEKGPISALAGTLVKILTPTSGWDSVTNTIDADLGTSEETDTELRLRQQQSTSATSSSLIDSLYGNLLVLPGVEFARVYQNRTLFVDSRGIDPKSVAAMVVGGVDEAIADAIFTHLSLGVDTFGTSVVHIPDELGVIYPVKFSRPAEIDVFVDVVVTVVDANLWPTDGDDQIKAAIIAYASGAASSLGICAGYDQDGYVPGQTVYASELYVPVNSVAGIRIDSIFVGTSGPTGSVSVAITWDEIAAFDSTNIDVTVN